MKRIISILLVLVVVLVNTGAATKTENNFICGTLTMFKGVTTICDSNTHPFMTNSGYNSYIWTMSYGVQFTTYTNSINLDFTWLCDPNNPAGPVTISVYGTCSGDVTNTIYKTISFCNGWCSL